MLIATKKKPVHTSHLRDNSKLFFFNITYEFAYLHNHQTTSNNIKH